MARYGLNVLKRTAFRGGTQHFGNTYYYETAISASNLTDLNLLVDEVVAKERALFSGGVTFVSARLWSQLGSPAQNNMLIDRALSGVGALVENAALDKERAFLVRFRAGTDTRGRPVYLRKWFHLGITTLASSAITNAQLQQTGELTTAQRSALETFGNSLAAFTVSGTPVSLVSKSGRAIDGATQAHRFLEHRQLGEEWRGA